MKEVCLKLKIQECSETELSTEDRELVEVARKACNDSYSPYSGFAVGAAVLLSNGIVMMGNNQENAAYPSGLCAERTALFAANSTYPNTPILALAIAGYTHGHFTKDVASPCGACRQVMLETETRFATPMKVILYCEEGCYVFDKASDLLPMSFAAENLEG